LKALVENPENQSLTVVTVKTDTDTLAQTKSAALAEGIQLGSGYGTWKPDTFRIANFPAHTEADFNKLCDFLKKF
jgi:phosphoserine aminotransferase